MDERIKDHLEYLNRYYLILKDLQGKPPDSFLNDAIIRTSAERCLQLAIESCLNIGNRLIALCQFKKPVKTPENYADIFIELARLGVIDHDFCERLVQMAKFRNRLVHMYWDIDKELVYKYVMDKIEDFKLFQKKIVEYLNNNDVM
jgi:uncharacterized protein YutE (UPF0331/DUF86 family)